MQERLLKLREVAELLSTSEKRARRLLVQYGLQPIDLGRGRSGGLRWLLSSVNGVMEKMAGEVRQQRLEVPGKHEAPKLGVLSMSIDQIYSLTSRKRVQ